MAYLTNALGLIPMAAFMWLLLLSRRPAPVGEREAGEGDYYFRSKTGNCEVAVLANAVKERRYE